MNPTQNPPNSESDLKEPAAARSTNVKPAPLLVFVVGATTEESNLVADLFSRAGHCAIPIRNLQLVMDVFRKVPPDMILVDDAIAAEDRSWFRTRIAACADARRVPVLDFSIRSIALGDRELEVGGYPIGLRRTARSSAPWSSSARLDPPS